MKLANLVSAFAVLGCVGAAAAGTIAAQGCTATLTTGGDDGGFINPGDDDSGTPVTQQDSGSIPPDPCNSCLYGQCSSLYAICVNDPNCVAIFNCSVACGATGTQACFDACTATKAASSVTLYDNLGVCDYFGECNGGSCATTCNPTADYCSPVVTGDDGGADSGDDSGQDSGTTVDSGPTEDAGTIDAAVPLDCQQCQTASCAAQTAACTTGNPCFNYTQCVLGCTTADCPAICATNNPTGVTAAKALGDCTTTSCPVCSTPAAQ